MHLPALNNVTLFAGLAAAGACWRQLLGLFQRLRAFVVVRVAVEDGLCGPVTQYCWRNFRRWQTGDRRYSCVGLFVRPVDRYVQVAFERLPTQPIVFWKGWKPLLLSAASGSLYPSGINDSRMVLTFLRGTFDPDILVQQAANEFNDLSTRDGKSNDHRRRFAVFRITGRDKNIIQQALPGVPVASSSEPSTKQEDGRLFSDRLLHWKPEDIGPRDPEDPMEAFAFPPEVEGLITEITRWKASEKWFKEKRIAWRRGFLLFGCPGTGKSSLIRALGQQLDLPIYVFDLATLSNEELVSHWKNMLANTPCIAAMEDLDTCFHGRENVSGVKGGLNFQCLLNVLSGIEESDGVFTVVTTNDITKIDPALGNPTADGGAISTRPGRLDRAVELKRMTEACRTRVARRILADCPFLIDETVAAGKEDTGAQFTERCGQLALREYWGDEGLAESVSLPTFSSGSPLSHEYDPITGSRYLKHAGAGDIGGSGGRNGGDPVAGFSARPPQPNRTHGA